MKDISKLTNEEIVKYLETVNKESALNAHYALNLWAFCVNREEAVALIQRSLDEKKTFMCRFSEGERIVNVDDIENEQRDTVEMWLETEETHVQASLFAHMPVAYVGIFNDMAAYSVEDSSLDGTISGYPKFVLVDKDMNCRYSTTEEALNIIDLKK